jgi:ABC-type branched-subunit amino acid transport system substrate-binding protein
MRLALISISLYILMFTSVALAEHTSTSDKELAALSINELLNIPLSEEREKNRIFQSDVNKISADTINFGLMMPFSIFPEYSANAVVAADLAANIINRAGGINGQRLVLIRANNKINAPISAPLAKALVEDYKAQAIIGPGTTDSVYDVLKEVTLPKQIPLISQAASSIKLTELANGGPFWQLVANNHQQVSLMMDYLVKELDHKSVYVIAGRDIYSTEIVEGIENYIKRSNKTIKSGVMLISDLVFLDGMDLSQDIKQIQNQDFQSIIITVQLHQMNEMIRKIEQHWQGPLPTIMATDVAKLSYLRDAKHGRISECILSYVSSPNEIDQVLQAYITNMINTDSAAYDAAYVFDGVMLFGMAKQLESTQGVSFKQAMLALTSKDGKNIGSNDYAKIQGLFKQHKKLSYSGYSGKIQFNAKGENETAQMAIYPLVDKISSKSNACLQQFSNQQIIQ